MRTYDLRAAFTAPATAFLVAVAATIAFLPRPAQAHEKLGANLNFIGDFRRNHEFADVVKQSRRFLKIGQFDDTQNANLAPIGADGWPTTDFRLFAMAAQQDTQNLAGAYTIVFNGQATLSTGGGGAGTITGQTFDAGTNTTRATLDFPAGAENFLIDFTGTGGAVKNLRVIRPGLNADNPPFLNAPWKNHVNRFPVVRFLDWTRTNGNRQVTWEDRTTPEKLKTEAYIAQWETVIDAANWLNRDPWINVPVLANDEYVTNLATLLRDRLNANLNVYVEYGNELWNFSIRDVDMDVINGGDAFNGATVNRDLAAASPPGSPLRFGGESDATTLGFRRVALRLKEISDIFKAVWGASAINARVRPVLAGQMANSFIVTEGLRVIDEGLDVRPDTVFYAISGAPYIFPAALPDGGADETPGMTVQQILDGLAAGVAGAPAGNAYQYLTHAGLGAWYGLKVVAYEAGFDNFGSQNVANKRLANLDPQIRDICKSLLNQWHGFGFEHILWFNAGADSYNTQFGMWPLVEDMANQATPKNQCMDDILAAPLPAITVGTPVLGAPIAGGNYQGSPDPTGGVSGLDGPFGFPGFVEYLLRADEAGTYSIVFNGEAPAGESFRLKLNNAVAAANVGLPAAAGDSAAVPVTLRKGLNAMRIERAVGASFSVASFAFTLTGDATPDPFSFAPKANVATGSVVTSDPATITGLTTAAGVTVAGGEYSVGCSGTFTSAAGTISNGQAVCVRHDAAASVSTGTTTTLTIGGVTASFTSTTAGAQTQQFALTVAKTGSGTVASVPAGIDCGATCAADYDGGASVVLAATPGPGFVFAGWGGSCTGTTTCQVTMLGARSVSATFLQLFTLSVAREGTGTGTITTSPAGIDCGLTCSASFSAVSPVTVIATPASGSIFSGWSGACSGTGACQVSMTQARSVAASFAPDTGIPRLANISTRGRVLTGNDVMIGGFVIGGTTPKEVLITARGPSLTAFGVTGALANPTLQLFSGQTLVAANDDFITAPNFAEIQATGIAPGSSLESALLVTLNPGAYTAIVSGVGGGTGVGIVEVFERGQFGAPLVNISTRGQVQTGDSVMIGGFIIQGDSPRTVLITARGPSLAPFGIANPLANPSLQLFSGQTLVAANDDFGTAPNLAQIQATGVAPTNALESAILVTLNPGAYTAIVTGVGGTTGVGIVEVFAQ